MMPHACVLGGRLSGKPSLVTCWAILLHAHIHSATPASGMLTCLACQHRHAACLPDRLHCCPTASALQLLMSKLRIVMCSPRSRPTQCPFWRSRLLKISHGVTCCRESGSSQQAGCRVSRRQGRRPRRQVSRQGPQHHSGSSSRRCEKDVTSDCCRSAVNFSYVWIQQLQPVPSMLRTTDDRFAAPDPANFGLPLTSSYWSLSMHSFNKAS